MLFQYRKKPGNAALQSLDDKIGGENDGKTRVEMLPADESTAPHEIAVLNELKAKVEKAAASLPSTSREILLMYEAEKMSYEEIAAALDLPIGTVKSRISRARQMFREKLKQLGVEA